MSLAIVAAVEWKEIRSAFVRTRGRRTQKQIAEEGGLQQGAISQLESNDDLGPTVGTFVKAVEGLGLRPSEFFRQIEIGAKPATDEPIGASAPLEAIGAEGTDARTLRQIGSAFFAAAAHAATPARADRPARRPRARKPKTGRGGD